MKTKEEIKRKIEEMEYANASGMGKLNGISVKVLNVELCKHTVHVDVIVFDADDNKKTRFNDVEYDRNYLENLIKN